mgnify:CR=1 FL=1
MLSDFLKSLSILKKFLFINLIIFLVIGSLTILYIGNVKPNLIKKKTTKHIQVIDNTIEHILRLDIKFIRRGRPHRSPRLGTRPWQRRSSSHQARRCAPRR